MAAENLPQIRFYSSARSASRGHSYLLSAANELEDRLGEDGWVRKFAAAPGGYAVLRQGRSNQ